MRVHRREAKALEQLRGDPCKWKRGVGKRCEDFYGGVRYVYFRVCDVEVPVVVQGALGEDAVLGRDDKCVDWLCAAVVKSYRTLLMRVCAGYLECAALAFRGFAR